MPVLMSPPMNFPCAFYVLSSFPLLCLLLCHLCRPLLSFLIPPVMLICALSYAPLWPVLIPTYVLSHSMYVPPYALLICPPMPLYPLLSSSCVPPMPLLCLSSPMLLPMPSHVSASICPYVIKVPSFVPPYAPIPLSTPSYTSYVHLYAGQVLGS